MAHHWSDQFENQMSRDEFDKLFQKDEHKPGATGKFPDGKIDPLDEGEIRLRIGVIEGRIVIDFGKSIASIGFTKQQALEIGQNLIEKALKL
jgi:hypothetical protein